MLLKSVFLFSFFFFVSRYFASELKNDMFNDVDYNTRQIIEIFSRFDFFRLNVDVTYKATWQMDSEYLPKNIQKRKEIEKSIESLKLRNAKQFHIGGTNNEKGIIEEYEATNFKALNDKEFKFQIGVLKVCR